MSITKKCLQCEKEFKTRPSHAKRRKYCSKACLALSKRNVVEISCNNCNKIFEIRYSLRNTKKYCSLKCWIEKKQGIKSSTYVRKKGKCKICNKNFSVKKSRTLKYCSNNCRLIDIDGENNPNWKGGRIIKQDGYAYLRMYNTYYPEHNFVMEKHLGRKLEWPDEEVHHKNSNKTDNRIENLELMSRKKHRRLHKTLDNCKHSLHEINELQ